MLLRSTEKIPYVEIGLFITSLIEFSLHSVSTCGACCLSQSVIFGWVSRELLTEGTGH